MADEPQVIRGIDWKATFPFVSLFRGFRVAIHPSKLILALVALMLIYFGGKVLDGIWPRDYRAVPNELGLYGVSHASVNPAETFKQRRWEVRAAVISAHKARLAQIPTSYSHRDDLDDYEWWVKQRLEQQVKEIRDSYDKRIAAMDDAYNKLPEKDKEAQEKDHENAKRDARLNRDNAINAAYTGAAADIDEAESYNGEGLFETFANFELGMLNQVVLGVRYGNWLGDGGVTDAIRSFFLFARVWAMKHRTVFFTICFLYFLCVWSIFGGA